MFYLYSFCPLAILVWVLVRYTRRYLIHQKLRHQHGTAETARVPQKSFHFGSDFLKPYDAVRRTPEWLPFIRKLLDNPGRTTSVSVWGEEWLFTSQPENIRAINTLAAGSMGVEHLRKPANSQWMGDGMFVSDGERWKLSRTLFKPMFSRLSISSFDSVELHFQRFLALIPADGSELDLAPMFKRLYFDISTEMLFGESVNSQVPEKARIDIEVFELSFATAMAAMYRKASLGVKFTLFDDETELKQHYHCVHRIFDEQIREALKNHKSMLNKESMLHSLIEHSSDGKFLRDQLLNVFLGAKDTAALGIGFVFFHLARHPRVWEKLKIEVGQVGTEPLTFELLKSMKYLQNTISESLRLLAPVTMSLRNATTDCILPRGGGRDGQKPVLVKKGTRLEVSIKALHQDEEIWGPDASEFWPERWEQGTAARTAPKWQYIPFLGGARMCPAQQMMLSQYAYLLVRFVQTFRKIENRDPELDFKAKVVFGQESANGVKVALYRRDE